MNRQKYSFLLLSVWVVFLSSALTAQDFGSAIKKMREAYEQSTRLHAVMEIAVHESDAFDNPYYFEKVEVFRDKDQYSYKFTDREMLMSDAYFIMVNKSTHEISVSQRNRSNESLLRQQMSFDLDSILSLYKEPEYMGLQDELDHYSLHQENGPIERIDLFLTRPESLLKELHYYYENGQFVSITFKVLNLQPQIKKEIFEEGRYIVLVDEKLKGAGKYQGYRVYEQH